MVDIIVPALNRADLTAACVAAVRTTAPRARIIVVDNGSDCPIDVDVDTILRFRTNRGFAAGCNAGAAVADTGLLVFLNNDTVPLPGWLDPLVDAAGTGDLAQPRLVYSNGTIQCSGVDLGVRNGILTAWNLTDDRPSGPVAALTGACLAITTDLFFDLGGFDQRYWNGYEDVDLCLRARRAGAICQYVATSTVVHHESQSGPQRWARVHDNVQLLNETWSASWQQPSTS